MDEKLSENKQNNVDKRAESKSEMSNFSQDVIQSQGTENTGLWFQKPRHDSSDISPSLAAKKEQKTGSSPLPVSSRKSVSIICI